MLQVKYLEELSGKKEKKKKNIIAPYTTQDYSPFLKVNSLY